LLVDLVRWMDLWLNEHVLNEDVAMARHLRNVPGWRSTNVLAPPC
jgi:hemerythrin